MHELSIALSLVEAICDELPKLGPVRVSVVHVRVVTGTAGEYELHTGDASRAAVTHGSFRITLVELQPYPFSSRTISQDEYRATFTVTRQ